MTQIEKMELFIRAMKREVEIEARTTSFPDTMYFPLHWNVGIAKFEIFEGSVTQWSIQELLRNSMEIRIAKSLPLLSDADAEFAEKYLPKDWFLVRNFGHEMYIFSMKPVKGMTSLCWVSNYYETESFWLNLLPTYPAFAGVKWVDVDCFTVQEMLDSYRENKAKTT